MTEGIRIAMGADDVLEIVLDRAADGNVLTHAMGDAIEELFVLAAKTGTENTRVVIVPYDFRKKTPRIAGAKAPAWLPDLYENLFREMTRYRRG